MRYRVLRFPGFRAKAFTLSFDDREYDDVRLAQMFHQYGMKCTFNISSIRFAQDPNEPHRKVTLEEAKQYYYPLGHEVAVHGLRHISPYQSSSPVMIHELLEDRIGLENIFGRIITGLAYPDDGRNTPEMTRRLADMGFHFCRCLAPDDTFSLPTDWLNLRPTTKHNSRYMPELLDKFLELNIFDKYISQRESKWFYMWGHSHELRGQNNWEIIDQVGEKVAGHDEIWFATNSEICEYVRAYQQMQFSADDHIAYNPTHYTIYLEVDKENVAIAPGETKFFS